MNFITGTALLAAVVIAALQIDNKRDAYGRGFFARVGERDLSEDDKTFLKLEAICLAVAFLSHAIL